MSRAQTARGFRKVILPFSSRKSEVMSREGALWMGDLSDYMDEQFIMHAFRSLGEEDLLSVKVMKHRYTGQLAGYCFLNFQTNEAGVNAMHKYNGKIIPNSHPPVKFKLNYSNARSYSGNPNTTESTEFSLWVGDLTPEVDDLSVYKVFASRYNSIKSAKVIYDNKGVSKGFAFVRFSNEDDHKDALVHMNGFRNLGSKPLKVSFAVPKKQTHSENTQQSSTDDYNSQYYNQYYNTNSNYDWAYSGQNSGNNTTTDEPKKHDAKSDKTDYELIEWNTPLDIDKANAEYVQKCEELWSTMEKVRWDFYNDLIADENRLRADWQAAVPI